MSDYFDAYHVNRNFRASRLESVVNRLPVNLLDFALISQLRHRAYGVRTFMNEQYADARFLNAKGRKEIWRKLFEVQQSLVAKNRVLLGPAYVEETKLVDPATQSFHARYAGIEAVNVVETLEFVDNLIISPFVVNDVTLVQNGGYIEAHFDKALAPDPKATLLRDSVTYEKFVWQDVVGYPAEDAENWVMVCASTLGASYLSDPTKSTVLQDYEYVYADIPEVDGIDLEDLVAVHPNSTQILPFAKPPERVLVAGEWKWRFWFYVWTLGKPEFDTDTIDLIEGEFHKLYNIIELYRRVESEQLGTVYIKPDQSAWCNNDTPMQDETAIIKCQVIDSEYGILKYGEVVERTPVTVPPTYQYNTTGDPAGTRYKIKIYYKVNFDPMLLNVSTEELRTAICAKAAAALFLESVGYRPEEDRYKDFLSEMQQEYTKEYVSPLTGAVAVNYKYGNRRGDLIFAEMINKLAFRKRGVFI